MSEDPKNNDSTEGTLVRRRERDGRKAFVVQLYEGVYMTGPTGTTARLHFARVHQSKRSAAASLAYLRRDMAYPGARVVAVRVTVAIVEKLRNP